MKRIDVYLGKSPAPPVNYPGDVKLMKSEIPELSSLSDLQVDLLYRQYSDCNYCASWLSVTQDSIDDFKNWLNGEYTEFDFI